MGERRRKKNMTGFGCRQKFKVLKNKNDSQFESYFKSLKQRLQNNRCDEQEQHIRSEVSLCGLSFPLTSSPDYQYGSLLTALFAFFHIRRRRSIVRSIVRSTQEEEKEEEKTPLVRFHQRIIPVFFFTACLKAISISYLLWKRELSFQERGVESVIRLLSCTFTYSGIYLFNLESVCDICLAGQERKKEKEKKTVVRERCV
jgi:hypothetical protein